MRSSTSITVPTVHTDRLVLRAFQASDAGPMATFFGDPISQFYGGPLDADDAWRRFAMYPGHWFLRGYGPWAIELRTTGEYLGLTGPWYPAGWIEPEITWALVPGHHGHGYATEAAGAALTATYEMFGWSTAVSVIARANAASIRVAERLGAIRERDVTYRYGDAYLYRHRAPAAP